ncbi:MAG: hypothetical protein FWG31_05435 [Oscillospiraceae bacterium]|nr:hypothetical protein [Oscillospiraceae bacterium]
MEKPFDDFLKSFTPEEIKAELSFLNADVLKNNRENNKHLSVEEQHISMAIDVASNLSLTFLGWYHNWLHDLPEEDETAQSTV